MHGFLSRLLLVLLIWPFLGCAEVRFISDYDAYTDESVTQLQRNVETLLIALERHPEPPACAYSRHVDAYSSMHVELNLLLARNAVRPDNGLTERQLLLLRDSIATLEELHRDSRADGCLSVLDIPPLRSAFNASFTAILKLELAKKRGPDNEE